MKTETAALVPAGTACPDCHHPWWAHRPKVDLEAAIGGAPDIPRCIGQGCRCARRGDWEPRP